VLVLSSVIVGVIVVSNETIGTTDSVLVEQALQDIAKSNNTVYENIQVIQKNNTHARGQLTDTISSITKDFYAQKIRDRWEIVNVGENQASCELYTARGFDPAFIGDCVKTYPDAQSVAVAKETLATLTKPTFLQIIAKVTAVETVTKFVSGITTTNSELTESEPTTETTNTSEEVTVVTVTSSDGTTLTTEIDPSILSTSNTPSVSAGDIIVITVFAEPNQSTENTTVQATEVVNITTEAEESPVVTSPSTAQTETNTTSAPSDTEDTATGNTPAGSSGTNDPGGVFKFIINTDAPDESGLDNVFDIDNSVEPIRIEG
jgi:hypothetical protein